MSAESPDSTEKTALLGGQQQGQPPAYTPTPPSAPPPYSNAQQTGPPPPQAHQQVVTTVIQTQPTIIAPFGFSDYPVTFTDSDGQQLQTILEYRAGSTTHLIACILCFVGWFVFFPVLCCFWIPYVLDGTKDVYHIHPIHGTVVGVYRRR